MSMSLMSDCGPDCPMCSGEWCAQHFDDPCDCDTVDRHAGEPSPSQADPGVQDGRHLPVETRADVWVSILS